MQQGKGLIKFFLAVMLIVCVIQLMYIFPTNRVENDADNYAMQRVAAMAEGPDKTTQQKLYRSNFLDSMSSEVVFSIPLLKKFTYQELKQRQLALGLDLKGGMSVVLQVDLKDFIKALANDSNDPKFLQALENASVAQQSAQDNYVSLFANAWDDVAEGKKMNSIFIRNEALRDEINSSTSDGEMARVIREKANETVDLTFKRLKERIDKLGVVQPNISLDAARDLILVELPGIDNPERARNFLSAAAKLEFWNVYRNADAGILSAFSSADSRLKKLNEGADEATLNQKDIRLDTLYTFTDDLGNIDSSRYTVDTVEVDNALAGSGGPLLSKLNLNTTGSFSPAVIGYAARNQRKAISEYLDRDDIKNLFPQDVKFLWAKDPIKVTEDNGIAEDTYELYVIKKDGRKDVAPLDGESVTDASASPDPQSGEVQVSLEMNQKGAQKWYQLTQKASADGNREIAIVLDDEVVSAPSVRQAIAGGRSSITGNFSLQEGKDLSNILQVGKLPARTEIIQESLVGPSLGAQNISRSLTSLMVGMGLLLLFMAFYYGSGGIISIIALLLNIVFVLGALASFGTVLTLPGIAGIILTIGMAVDANVIIYERIREELREGKSLLMAIQDGFANSYSAIIDANVTTLLVAGILIYFGLGPIKGFAVVLAIGVISSVFTAVLVGRMMIDWWVGKGNELTFWTGASKNAFANVNYDWLGKRKMAYAISLGIIALGIVSMIARGFELGVDFKGGYSYNVQFAEGVDVDNEAIRQALTAPFGAAPIVKAVDTDNTFNITTSYLIDDTESDAADRVMAKLYEGINGIAGGKINANQFKSPDGVGTHVISSSKVGPTIADDISKSARYATIFALLAIFAYIFIRFNKWQYSMGAVAALAHDTMIVLSLFSIFHGILPFSLEIDQAFIAALLTVIGYSINDTVVVFDRIREFMGTYVGKTKDEIINMAINSTVSRTVITSVTTLFVVFVLFIFGSGSIKGFAFALLVGILVGTYSSIFVATPVMADLTDDLKPKATTQNKKKSFSRAARTAS